MKLATPDAASLFCAAMDLATPDEVDAYLNQACGPDQGLRRRVEKLLAAHRQAGSFLEATPSPAVTTRAPIGEGPGTVIGPYTLIAELGEGGFGIVFLAEQAQPVRRQVALKILKPGMDSRQVVARFEAERQALAIMDHPNIAKVFDGGVVGVSALAGSAASSHEEDRPQPERLREEDWSTPPLDQADRLRPLLQQGRPYFVMELVRGQTVTAYCDQQQLSLRQRLELFVPICQAVQHAHQKGIIHRDLKPSNVLVANPSDSPLAKGRPGGVPKVIDFGVAKALGQELTDKTLRTGQAQMIGTPLYMSPEQAGEGHLDVDTRSDVYSLGALLYELLTGTTPFEKGRFKNSSYDEVRRIIRAEEPPRPSTRVLSRATHRSDRAPAGLSRALRGDLDWIVMKCLEKDRQRRYATANGLALDVQRYLANEPVLAGPPTVGYQLRKFLGRNRHGVATAALVAAATLFAVGAIGWAIRDRTAQRQEAAKEQALRQARLEAQIGAVLTETASASRRDDLVEAAASLKQAEGLLASSDGATDDLRQRVRQWRDHVALLEELQAIRLKQAAPRATATAAYDTGNADAAYGELFRRYGMDFDFLTPAEAARRIEDSAIKDQLLAAIDHWLQVRRELRGRPAAEWQPLLEIARAVDKDAQRTQLREAILARDLNVIDQLTRPEQLEQVPVATALYAVDVVRWTGGLPSALRLLQRLQLLHPGDFWVNYQLGLHHALQNNVDEAIRFYTVASTLRPASATILNDLGNALITRGRYEEASGVLQKAVQIAPRDATAVLNLGVALENLGREQEAFACFRLAADLDPTFAIAHVNLGTALCRQRKFDEAIARFRQALALAPDVADTHARLGLALTGKREFEAAVTHYRLAIELNPRDPGARNNLATAYFELGKLADGANLLREMITLNLADAQAHTNLGYVLVRMGQGDDAIPHLRKAIELDPKHVYPYVNLGHLLVERRRLAEAIACYRQAVAALPNDARCHNLLAWWLSVTPDLSDREPERALELAQRAVQLDSRKPGYWRTLGVAHYRTGNWQESATALHKSMALGQAEGGVWFLAALAQARLGRKEEASGWYDKGIAWMNKHPSGSVDVGQLRDEARELLGMQPKD